MAATPFPVCWPNTRRTAAIAVAAAPVANILRLIRSIVGVPLRTVWVSFPEVIFDVKLERYKVRYLDTSGPSMARRSTRPWERRHLLSTDWCVNTWIDFFKATFPPLCEIYFLIVRPDVDDARSTKSIARLRLVRQRKQ